MIDSNHEKRHDRRVFTEHHPVY